MNSIEGQPEFEVSIKIEMEKISDMNFPVANWPLPTPKGLVYEQPSRKAKEKKKCGDCGVFFNRFHECRVVKDINCKYCQRTFHGQEKVSSHEKTCKIYHKYVEFGTYGAVGEGNAKVKCTVCQRNFGTQPALFRHLQRIHSDLFLDDVTMVKFNCQGCNQSFKFQAQLKKHKKICGVVKAVKDEKKKNPKVKQDTTCQTCFATFANKAYKNHAQTCAKYQNLIYGSMCLICHKSFEARKKLLNHVTSVHRQALERNQRNLAQKRTCEDCKEIIEIKYYEQHQERCHVRLERQKQKAEDPQARQAAAQVPKENDPLLVPNRKCNLCNETVPRNEFTFHYQTCSRAFTFVQDTLCKICKLHWGNPRDVLLHILDTHAANVTAASAVQDHQQQGQELDGDDDEFIEEHDNRGLLPVAVRPVNVPADLNNNPIIANLPSRNNRYHDGQMEDPFNIKKLVVCPMCTGKFAYKEDLFNHMSLYHRVPANLCLNIGLEYRIINV